LVLYTVPAEVVNDSEVEVDKSDEAGIKELGWLEVEGIVDVGEVVVGIVDVGWVVMADETAEVELGSVTGMDEDELEVTAEVTGRVDDAESEVTGWEAVGAVVETSSEVAAPVDVTLAGIEEELGAAVDSAVETSVVAREHDVWVSCHVTASQSTGTHKKT